MRPATTAYSFSSAGYAVAPYVSMPLKHSRGGQGRPKGAGTSHEKTEEPLSGLREEKGGNDED